MGKSVMTTLFAALLFASVSAAQIVSNDNTSQTNTIVLEDGKYVPGEILVCFRSGTVKGFPATRDQREINISKLGEKSITMPPMVYSLLNDVGVSAIEKVFKTFTADDTVGIDINKSPYKVDDLSQLYLLKLPGDKNLVDAIKQLMSHGEIIFAEPNYKRELFYDTNDPMFYYQWGLSNSSYPGIDIGAKAAWDMCRGNLAIKIGIVDEGIDYTHADLGGYFHNTYKVVGGWNWADNNSDPRDVSGHGTHCAGIAAAFSNNNTGIAGVAGGLNQWDTDKGCQLFAFKIDFSSSQISAAIEEGARPTGYGCHVLNCSFGGPDYSETERWGIGAAHRYGATVVFAKGNWPQSGVNSATQLAYPADYDFDWILSVGNLKSDGVLSGSSCYGNNMDVLAPGNLIWSTLPNGQYGNKSGTSMAAPHVAGLAGLLRSDAYMRGIYLHVDDVEGIIKYSADASPASITELYNYDRHRFGLIKADRALQLLRDPYVIARNTASGGYSVSSTSNYAIWFYNYGGGLATDDYSVKRHEVRVNVTYPNRFNGTPYVWGRGVGASNGWSANSPNYEMGFCEVVPGSQTSTGCQLRAYVYEVWEYNILGQTGNYLGWYPCQPSQVAFAYTLLGKYFSPSAVTMSGYYQPYTSTKVPTGYTNLSWGCNPGSFPVTYTVQIKEPYNSGTWSNFISNTTSTSYSYQHLPAQGGAGYQVIVNDGKTTTYSGVCVIYPPNPGDPVIANSGNVMATAYSNGKKLALDNTGKLHVTYTSGDTVYYTASTDDGNTWSQSSFVGLGKNPAIQLKPAGSTKGGNNPTSAETPSICYISGNQLYNTEQSGTAWSTPACIYQGQPEEEISYLSYILDQQRNQSYLGWVSATPSGSQVCSAPHTPGSTSQLMPRTIDIGPAHDLFKSPSLTLDKTGNLITAWSRDGLVKYSDPVEGTIELSSTDKYSIHPIVSTYGDRTSVTWMEQTSPVSKNEPGKYQIVTRERTPSTSLGTGPSGWSDPQVISFPDSGDAQFPVAAAHGQYIFTKETGDGNYDINYYGNYANNWETYIQNISYSSGGQSGYPDVVFRPSWPNHKLYIVWTEVDTPGQSKALIPQARAKIYVKSIEPVPELGVYPNTNEQSPYSTQRAGAFCYGSGQYQTVDYHPEKLAYHFDNLDPKMKYQIKAVYYWTNSGSGKNGHRDDWREMLKADQTTLANTWVPETTVVKVTELIPKHCYSDGQVDISIERKKGDYAICAGLELIAYEDEKGGHHGGSQLETGSTLPLAYQFKLMQSVPNPTNGKAAIAYQIATGSKVSLKVYNTLGQVVNTLVDEGKQPGSYQAIWNGKDNAGKTAAAGIYFYRLISGEKSETKKMVVIQ